MDPITKLLAEAERQTGAAEHSPMTCIIKAVRMLHERATQEDLTRKFRPNPATAISLAPVVCACRSWATDDQQADMLGNGHHHNCELFKPTVGAVRIIAGLLKGIRYWASQEDGVPDELWEAYREAVFVVEGRQIKEGGV